MVSVTELPAATLSEVLLGAIVTEGGGPTVKMRVALLLVKPAARLVYTAEMVCDPTARAFDTAAGSVATPELFTAAAG